MVFKEYLRKATGRLVDMRGQAAEIEKVAGDVPRRLATVLSRLRLVKTDTLVLKLHLS